MDRLRTDISERGPDTEQQRIIHDNNTIGSKRSMADQPEPDGKSVDDGQLSSQTGGSSSSANPQPKAAKKQHHQVLIASVLERYNRSLPETRYQFTLPSQDRVFGRSAPELSTKSSQPSTGDQNSNRNSGQPRAAARQRQPNADARRQRTAVPHDHDVLFGRAKSQKQHPGNKYLRQLCDNYRPQYDRAGRKDKLQISRTIVNVVKSRGGCFLKFDHGQKCWFRVSDEEARLKVGHMLRDGRSQEPVETVAEMMR